MAYIFCGKKIIFILQFAYNTYNSQYKKAPERPSPAIAHERTAKA
jgi:hypothetical protein